MSASSIRIAPPADDADLRAFVRLADQAFASPPPVEADIEPLRRGIANVRLAHVGGAVAGGLGIIPMGQWFGGRRVPMAGIYAVAIAPEHRGGGIASLLLRRMLEDIRAQGLWLSTLYPATQPVYRRAGYEQAGVRMAYAQPLHALATRDRSLRIRAATREDEGVVRELYARRAALTAGNLDRSDYMWDRVLRSEREVIYGYVAERDGVAEGYITYSLRQERDGRDIVARDLVALTPDASRRLLSFLADHRSTDRSLVWHGAPADTLLFHIPNQAYRVVDYEQWMLRVVDVRRALEARGYWSGVDTELHLEIADDVLAENARRLVVRITGGRAEVRDGGEGRVRLDVRGLAPLYTGYLSARDLRSTGYIEAAHEELDRLSAVFAGPTPWMVDGF